MAKQLGDKYPMRQNPGTLLFSLLTRTFNPKMWYQKMLRFESIPTHQVLRIKLERSNILEFNPFEKMPLSTSQWDRSIAFYKNDIPVRAGAC